MMNGPQGHWFQVYVLNSEDPIGSFNDRKAKHMSLAGVEDALLTTLIAIQCLKTAVT
jgi:hypothetical protein